MSHETVTSFVARIRGQVALYRRELKILRHTRTDGADLRGSTRIYKDMLLDAAGGGPCDREPPRLKRHVRQALSD